MLVLNGFLVDGYNDNYCYCLKIGNLTISRKFEVKNELPDGKRN
jgi:hypothetical protein